MRSAFLAETITHQSIIDRIAKFYTDEADDPQDLSQEIWLQLWIAYPSFRHQSSVTTWMYRVALNTALTYRKKYIREKHNLIKVNGILTNVDEYSIQEILNEQEQLLWKGILQLNKLDKALIILYIDGLSYKEMSDITGYTESNTGVRLSRIKQKLKQSINETEENAKR